MDIEIRPLFVANFIKKYSSELNEEENEYIGNVLLGDEDEYTEALYVAIEEDDVDNVKLIINKIINGEDDEDEEENEFEE